MAAKNFMNIYDQMRSGQVSNTTVTKKSIQGVEPKGGKNFVKCTEAYDKIFSNNAPQQPQQHKQVVLSESQQQEAMFRRMGAIQFLKEHFQKNDPMTDVDGTVQMLRDIVSSF
jgi:hypothetical protein